MQSVQTLDKDFESATQLSLSVEPNEHSQPPILIVDTEHDSDQRSPFRIELVGQRSSWGCNRYRLYCRFTQQQFAGEYYQHEVETFQQVFTGRGWITPAQFYRVAESVVDTGLATHDMLTPDMRAAVRGGSHEHTN
ncbi:MAG: hypothetical protein F6K31_06675 [Symploca sp. SIO2G7]|nr:hypothetical protein [Symploca sp. SIO2G7]